MANNDKEIWKQISLPKGSTTKNYAISNHGRIASFEKDINDRYVLSLHTHEGYKTCSLRVFDKSKALFPHNLIGEAFLKKPSAKHIRVIHLDYNKSNNHISNLKWVTAKEFSEHNQKSPSVIKAIQTRVYNGNHAKKLDEKKVIQLKKEIWNPKRKLTLKQLADKFGIAEMNLYRIKNGELWYYVRVEGEPMNDNYKKHLKNLEYHKKQEAKAKIESDKKAKLREAKAKASAERKKKKEAEKKARLQERLKRQKEKTLNRIAVEKRKAERAKLAAKRKKETATKKPIKKATKVAVSKTKTTPKNYSLVKVTKKAKKK